jgi:hypothetical protein
VADTVIAAREPRMSLIQDDRPLNRPSWEPLSTVTTKKLDVRHNPGKKTSVMTDNDREAALQCRMHAAILEAIDKAREDFERRGLDHWWGDEIAQAVMDNPAIKTLVTDKAATDFVFRQLIRNMTLGV